MASHSYKIKKTIEERPALDDTHSVQAITYGILNGCRLSWASGDISTSFKLRNENLNCMAVYRPAFLQSDYIISVSKNCKFDFATNRIDGIVSLKFGMPEFG